MNQVLLSYKDLEHLLRKQLPDCSVIKWTEKGLLLDMDLQHTSTRREKWGEIVIYSFKNIIPLNGAIFKVRGQEVNQEMHYQMCIE